MKWVLLVQAVSLCVFAQARASQMRIVALPGNSPVVTLRLVFTTGAARDPEDKPGLARLTAEMLAGGGSKDLTYKQIVDVFFPMAASVGSQVDMEMTTFSGATHVDNLEAYYKLFRAMLLDPGWREDDFKRLKDSAINSLRVGLRGNNDEELGKEVLLSELYRGTPYGHYSLGAVSALQTHHHRRPEAILQTALYAIELDYRDRGRLRARISGSPQEGFWRAARERHRARAGDPSARDRAYSRVDRGKEYALGGILVRLPHRREARRSGLSRATGHAILFRAASRERRTLVPAHSRDSRHQLRRLRLHRVFSRVEAT